MLNCQEVTRLASDYLERRLGIRRRLGVLLHLLMCDGCRAYLEQFRLTLLALAALPAPEISVPGRDELMAAFRKQTQLHEKQSGGPDEPTRPYGGAP